MQLAHASKPSVGPLVSMPIKSFRSAPENAQLMYTMGALDGLTLSSYNHGDPDHEAFVKCMRSMTLGEINKKLVEYLNEHPTFSEGPATALTLVAGQACKQFRKSN